jgi:hypothetical protein
MSVHARPTVIVMDADLEGSFDRVRNLAADGYNIVIPFYDNSVAANRIVSEVEARGGTAVALFANLRNQEHVAAVMRTTQIAFGRCDLVLRTGEHLSVNLSAAAVGSVPRDGHKTSEVRGKCHWKSSGQMERTF